MEETIELAIACTEGIADCRLELENSGNEHYYNVTILYPSIVNGYSRSEIYCHKLVNDAGTWRFEWTEDAAHPKIMKLEQQLASAITMAGR